MNELRCQPVTRSVVLFLGLAGIVCQTIYAKEIAHLAFEPDKVQSLTLAPLPESGPGKIGKGIRLPAGRSSVLTLPDGLTGKAGGIECWIRANSWDASCPEEIELLSVALADDDGIRLVKPAGDAVLRLTRNGATAAEMPIYDWFPRNWLTSKAIAAHGWRLLTISWDAGGCRLFFDGTAAPVVTGRVAETYPEPRILRLGGPANKVETGFDELRLHDDSLPPEKMSERYLSLYYNEFDYRPQRITAAFLAVPPRIDGRLDKDEWAQAAALYGFSALARRNIEKPVRVFCGYDRENIYMGFMAPYSGALNGIPHAPRDKHPAYSDNMEIYLDPSQNTEPPYYQLYGNVFGAICDNQAMDYSWNPEWEWKTDVGNGFWTAEARIPFRSVNLSTPMDGQVWGANFTAARPWTHWSLAAPFHSRKQFGHLVFDRRAPVVRIERLDTGTPGALTASYTLGNFTDRPLKCESAVQVIPPNSISAQLEERPAPVVLKAGEVRTFNMSLDVGRIPAADFVFSVSCDNRLVSYQHYAYDHTVPTGKKVPPTSSAAKSDDKKNEPAPANDEKRWNAETLGEEVLLREQWAGNSLGRSDETMEPWPAIEVQDDRLAVWGREIAYDGGLLPGSIKSQSVELLSGPVRLVAEQKGKKKTTAKNGKTELPVVRHGSGKISFNTDGNLAGLTVNCRQTLEFDGMLRLELTVRPEAGPVTVDQLALEVPLQREVARYFHVIGDSNQPPDTDVGILPKEGLNRGFVPMVWLGTERVGLAWFAEDFRDWFFVQRENLIQVVPQKDNVVLRVNLISAPYTVNSLKTFTFGLQATPMRPRPADWRNWHLSNTDDGEKGAINWTWDWGPTAYCFSHDSEFVRAWVEKNWKQKRPVVPISSLRYYAAFYLNHPGRGIPNHPKNGLITPEYKLWGKEWEVSPLTVPFDVVKDHYRKDYCLASACIASSYQDYYVFTVNRMIEKAGINGLYLDQPLKNCGNATHGCGYLDCQGVWQGRFLIFSARETLKRLRRIFQEKHGFTRIMLHMSNQMLVPVMSLSDIVYDGENYNCGPLKVYDHYSQVISLPRYRIQHSLQAFGPVPMLMDEFTHRGDRLDSTREFTGYHLLHDGLGAYWTAVRPEGEGIAAVWRAFAGQPGVECYPYWENGNLLRVQPDTVKVSLYRKDNTLFIVAVNTDPQAAQTAELRFSLENLKIGDRIVRAEDAFTGAALPTAGTMLRLPARNLDFRFVKVHFEDGKSFEQERR